MILPRPPPPTPAPPPLRVYHACAMTQVREAAAGCRGCAPVVPPQVHRTAGEGGERRVDMTWHSRGQFCPRQRWVVRVPVVADVDQPRGEALAALRTHGQAPASKGQSTHGTYASNASTHPMYVSDPPPRETAVYPVYTPTNCARAL